MYLETLPLEIQVKEFIQIKVDSACCLEQGLCGEPYKDDIYFNEDGVIEASRFRFQHVALVNETIYLDSIVQTKNVLNKFSKQFTLMPGKTNAFILNGEEVKIDSAYPYSLFYVFFDQYLFIRGISIQNTLIALASIFLAVQLIMNIKSALVVIIF